MNMPYCRFHNTVRDLRDCEDHIDERLSPEEAEEAKDLIRVCKRIAGMDPDYIRVKKDEDDDE